jgi:hypothetical protein
LHKTNTHIYNKAGLTTSPTSSVLLYLLFCGAWAGVLLPSATFFSSFAFFFCRFLMFGALLWLLDLNPAQSSSSSDADSVSYQHSRSSSSSSTSRSTDVLRTVPPTTFTDARGGAVVAELRVNATDHPTRTRSSITGPDLSISVPDPRRDALPQQQQRDNSLFADLYAQSTNFFASADSREEITYSATSPQTVPVWNLSTYTSEAVSVTPLPSPSYGQAPANPSAAFYSLAEHGAAVGRTLWSSEGAVLSACFPASGEEDAAAASGGSGNDLVRTKQRPSGPKRSAAAAAAPIVVAARRGVAALGEIAPTPASAAVVVAALSGTATGAEEEVALTPASRIMAWDEEVRDRLTLTAEAGDNNGDAEGAIVVAVTAAAPEATGDDDEDEDGVGGREDPYDTVPAALIEVASPPPPQHGHSVPTGLAPPAVDPTTGLTLPSPSPAAHVVQLRPSNPFLMSIPTTATALPRSTSAPAMTAAVEMNNPFASPPQRVVFSTTPGALATVPGRECDVMGMVSVSGLDGSGGADAGDSNLYTFMEHALRQRTEELLHSETTNHSNSGSGDTEISQTRSSHVASLAPSEEGVVKLGDGLVTLVAMEVQTPWTPSRTATPATSSPPRRKPVFDFS